MTIPSDSPLSSDDFSFWFALKLAVDAKDWSLLSEQLEASPAQTTPRHTLTIPVLEAAVLAGKPAIVAALIARGFVPVHDDLRAVIDKIEFLPAENLERVRDAVQCVIKATSEADLRSLVTEAWNQIAAPAVIPQLALAGVDVLLGGDVIDNIVKQARPELMQLLIEQGMSPFAPQMISAMMGDQRRDNDVHQIWLRAVCAHRGARSALARFDHMRATGGQWRAAAFINPLFCDRSGAEVTLLGIVAAFGRVADVFDARHWQEAREDALALHAQLAEFNMQDKVSLAPFAAALNRGALHARTQTHRSGKFKL